MPFPAGAGPETVTQSESARFAVVIRKANVSLDRAPARCAAGFACLPC
jgi:hypothetical protein